MGVPVRIVLYAPDAATARAAARAGFTRIAELEDVMSDFRAESEIRRLTLRPGVWVRVSPELFAVLALALDVARLTDGAFDPTLGPLTALWRKAAGSGRLPTPEALEEARSRTGWEKVELDVDAGAIRLAHPDMTLDLGGIAKGFILDETVAAIRRSGVHRALVEAGGDIRVGAAPPGRVGWRIDVPGASRPVAERAAALVDAALAVSGPTARFVEVGGVRYSHVVDPGTGSGVTSSTHAAVIAPSGAVADALATALTLIGAGEQGRLLARFPDAVAHVRPGDPHTVPSHH